MTESNRGTVAPVDLAPPVVLGEAASLRSRLPLPHAAGQIAPLGDTLFAPVSIQNEGPIQTGTRPGALISDHPADRVVEMRAG